MDIAGVSGGGNCHLFLSHYFIWYSHRQLKKFYLFLLSQLFPLTSSPKVNFSFILFLWLQNFRVKHIKIPAENNRKPAPAHWGQLLNPDWTPNSSWYRDADLLWHVCCQGISCKELYSLPAESLSTVPSPDGVGSVPKNCLSSPVKGCSSFLSPTLPHPVQCLHSALLHGKSH